MNKEVYNKAFMLRWYDQLWNFGNEETIEEMMHEQCRAFGLGPEPVIGPDGFKHFYRSFTAAYSDIQITVDKNLVDGDYVITLCTCTAVHKESGRPVNFTGNSVALIENGKILSGWNYFDFLTMYMQTGKITPEQLG
ncbi:MAG: ester cyclase [Bacteroidota bacterium]|nr:ester cyclase [Bacteroidota bacterium]